MTALQLREWQLRLGYTNAKAAILLGVSDSLYSQMRDGVHRSTGRRRDIDHHTALACVALELMYLRPACAENDRGLELSDACRPMLCAVINTITSGAPQSLDAVQALVQADLAAAKTLFVYLDAHGDKLMPKAVETLLAMVTREAARRLVIEIEHGEDEK